MNFVQCISCFFVIFVFFVRYSFLKKDSLAQVVKRPARRGRDNPGPQQARQAPQRAQHWKKAFVPVVRNKNTALPYPPGEQSVVQIFTVEKFLMLAIY